MSHQENPPLPEAVFLVASSVAGRLPSVFTVSNFECADTENVDHRADVNQRGRESRADMPGGRRASILVCFLRPPARSQVGQLRPG